jgi:hypothetical protein
MEMAEQGSHRLRRVVGQSERRLGGEHAPSAVPAGTAKVLSFKAATAVWATTIVTSGAIVAAAPWPSDPGVIDISGSWELSTIQVIENKYVADPPSLQSEHLVFERDGDTFLITQGPELLRGTAVSPEKVTGDEILARSERTGRADCLGSSGEGATEGVYAETASWEFMRTGAPGEDGTLRGDRYSGAAVPTLTDLPGCGATSGCWPHVTSALGQSLSRGQAEDGWELDCGEHGVGAGPVLAQSGGGLPHDKQRVVRLTGAAGGCRERHD